MGRLCRPFFYPLPTSAYQIGKICKGERLFRSPRPAQRNYLSKHFSLSTVKGRRMGGCSRWVATLPFYYTGNINILRCDGGWSRYVPGFTA